HPRYPRRSHDCFIARSPQTAATSSENHHGSRMVISTHLPPPVITESTANARRYALFTLSALLGKMIWTAPDLDASHKLAIELPRSDPRNQSNGQAGVAERSPRGREKPSLAPAMAVLTPEQSAILRERLLAQLIAIGSADEAALWAQRNPPAKNTLTAVDAKIVEERFRARLFTISDGEDVDGTRVHPMVAPLTCRLMLPSTGTSYLLAERIRTPARKL